MAPNSLTVFYSPTSCRLYLEEICKSFQLCPKYCHLQENVKTCSHYRITNCDGVCRGKETTENYNEKVMAAMAHISSLREHFIIKEKGRTPLEDAFVIVKDSTYLGYGFVEKEFNISSYADLDIFLIHKPNTLEAESIIKSYVTKNLKNVLMDWETFQVQQQV